MSRKDFQFQLRRAGGLFGILLRNKMSLTGLILIIIFSFIALAAPMLTPYRPTDVVSGSLAEPEWVMNFPDGYYLSKNLVVSSDPWFSSPAGVQAWTISTSASAGPSLDLSYAQGVSASPSSRGSVQMIYTGTTPGSVTFSQTFQFPYHGPPKKFIATFQYMVSENATTNPVHVRLFIDRVGDQVFNLYDTNETFSGTWLPQVGGWEGDSVSQSLKHFLRVENASLSPAEIIFSAQQSYRFGVEFTFYGPQKVNLGNLQLSLYGTAFGLLGTDSGGNDLFTKNIYGARISLFVGLLAAGIGVGLGLLIGLMAGFLGKVIDETLMRFTDMMLTIPFLPLLIVLVAVLGANIWNIIIVIGFLGWMGFARIVRSQVLSLKERPFIEAARAAGAGPFRIMTRHVFPNIVSLTYVNLALAVPTAIISEAALAFLGLSDPSVISWGHIFYDVQQAGALNLTPPPWWWMLPPGFLIATVSLSFILLGYALDEIFNPKLRRRR